VTRTPTTGAPARPEPFPGSRPAPGLWSAARSQPVPAAADRAERVHVHTGGHRTIRAGGPARTAPALAGRGSTHPKVKVPTSTLSPIRRSRPPLAWERPPSPASCPGVRATRRGGPARAPYGPQPPHFLRRSPNSPASEVVLAEPRPPPCAPGRDSASQLGVRTTVRAAGRRKFWRRPTSGAYTATWPGAAAGQAVHERPGCRPDGREVGGDDDRAAQSARSRSLTVNMGSSVVVGDQGALDRCFLSAMFVPDACVVASSRWRTRAIGRRGRVRRAVRAAGSSKRPDDRARPAPQPFGEVPGSRLVLWELRTCVCVRCWADDFLRRHAAGGALNSPRNVKS